MTGLEILLAAGVLATSEGEVEATQLQPMDLKYDIASALSLFMSPSLYGTQNAGDPNQNIRIGSGSAARDTGSIAIGVSANAGHDALLHSYDAIALGSGSYSEGNAAIGLGRNASAYGVGSLAIGEAAATSAYYATAISPQASASGTYSVALGHLASATGIGSVAIGRNAQAHLPDAVSIGEDAYSSNGGVALGNQSYGIDSGVALGTAVQAQESAVAIGHISSAGDFAIAVGRDASAVGNAMAAGLRSNAAGDSSIALGVDTTAVDLNAVAIGTRASANGVGAFALGRDADAQTSGAMAFGRDSVANGFGTIAFGMEATAESGALAFGRQSSASGFGATSIGYLADSTGSGAIAIGREASVNANGAGAIGWGAQSNHANAFAFGPGAITSMAEQFMFGTAVSRYSMPGIVSLDNRLSNPAWLIGSDANGNLGSVDPSAYSGTSGGSALVASTPTADPAARAEMAALRGQVDALQAQLAQVQVLLTQMSGETLGQSPEAAGHDTARQPATLAAGPESGATTSPDSLRGRSPRSYAGTPNRNALYGVSRPLALTPAEEMRLADVEASLSTLSGDISALALRVDGLDDRADVNTDGVAVALAMAGVTGLQSNERFALSANWGHYDSANAFAFSGAARFSQQITINAGLGFGSDTGELGARAGVRMGW